MSLHDHKKTSTPLPPSRPPPPPPHRQRLLNIVLTAHQPSHSHASRPQQHGPEVLHGFRRADLVDEVGDSATVAYDSAAPGDAVILTSIALYSGATRNGDPWPAPGFTSQSRKGRTDWLLSSSTTTRWPAPGWLLLLLLNGFYILKE